MKAKKQWLMFTWSLLVLAGFFALPQNRKWLFVTAGGYWKDFMIQKDHPELSYRLSKRWENPFRYSKMIAQKFEGRKKDSVLILMPPTNYFNHYGIKYHVPEPAVFYYYTGLKTIWANSKQASKANWYVRVQNGKLVVDSAVNLQSLKDTIAAFNKFGVTL
jgi:hypothetical protein